MNWSFVNLVSCEGCQLDPFNALEVFSKDRVGSAEPCKALPVKRSEVRQVWQLRKYLIDFDQCLLLVHRSTSKCMAGKGPTHGKGNLEEPLCGPGSMASHYCDPRNHAANSAPLAIAGGPSINPGAHSLGSYPVGPPVRFETTQEF